MTEKLYDQDAYAVEFDAKVLSCEAYHDKDESGYHVVLDRTLFYPQASIPSSAGRNRGQTFSDDVITDAARRVPISTASSNVF